MVEERKDDYVKVKLADYDALKTAAGEEAAPDKPWWSAPDDRGWIWVAPEYFSRWRVFPRAFISMYIYLLFESATWFMALPDPNPSQAGLISVLVGAGAAWFGLYVNSTSTDYKKD